MAVVISAFAAVEDGAEVILHEGDVRADDSTLVVTDADRLLFGPGG